MKSGPIVRNRHESHEAIRPVVSCFGRCNSDCGRAASRQNTGSCAVVAARAISGLRLIFPGLTVLVPGHILRYGLTRGVSVPKLPARIGHTGPGRAENYRQ
jgi:hypothetical protein